MPEKNTANRNNKDYTIRDVARVAGVSVATAGRVIGGYGSVSAKSVQAVMEAVKKLNYIPNGVAQSMKKKNTKTIGLVIANIANPYFSSIARLVEEFLVQEGYNMIICNTDEDSDREASYLKTLYEKRIDGLMIASALKESEKSREEIDRIYRGSIPTIIIDREIPYLDFPAVTSDNFKGAYDATSHLIKLGHKRIGVIGANISTLFRRVEGYKQALIDHFLVPEDYLIASDRSPNVKPGDIKEGIEATKRLLQNPHNRPTAIIALNNLLTTGALLAIDEMGLKIPDDVALIGWDDFDLAPLLKPPITVVKQSSFNIAHIACSRLLELISNPDRVFADQNVVLATELIIRGSCGYKAN